MAGPFNGDVARLRTMRGRLKAIQDGFERALRDLTDEALSKECRQWIKLAHEITERRDIQAMVKKLRAAMDLENEPAQRGSLGTEEAPQPSAEEDLQ